MYWKAKKLCVTHFIAIFTLLEWSETELLLSLTCVLTMVTYIVVTVLW